jgi:hypothetical protein
MTDTIGTPPGPTHNVFTARPHHIRTDPFSRPHPHLNLEHYANPMVHPITGKTISSYKKLMHELATAESWQTAFGKDFGGMAQGENKTGQKGTNAMFVMTHDEIAHAYQEKKFFTFANSIVDYRPQKDDPNRIQITAMGNLINYDGRGCIGDFSKKKIFSNTFFLTANL